MSLLADYLMEREGREVIEDERGFASYDIDGDVCYIIDIYVRPAFRREGTATQIANQICDIALKRGCNTLLGSVDPTTNNATDSLKVLLAYGFELQGIGDKLIFFQKGI